jgi:transcription termination factor NusB
LYSETPNIVAINEAVELSKKYSEPKVTKMINATLDSIYHNEDLDE